MKLVGCTFIGNEKMIVKYVMPYIINCNYDKLIIYDDSYDDSADMIRAYNLPFIEIRDYHSDKKILEDFESDRIRIEHDLFLELKKEANETKEEIWFAFMDFDEVVFQFKYFDKNFKFHIWEYSDLYKVNYYAGKSAQLISDFGTCQELDNALKGNCFVHSLKGMQCIGWPYYGTKVSFIKVNDIAEAYFSNGNHNFKCKMEKDILPINLYDYGNVFSFHLKFITKEEYMYKISHYLERFSDISTYEEIEYGFNMDTSVKFPLNLLFYDDFNKYGYQKYVSDGEVKGGICVI